MRKDALACLLRNYDHQLRIPKSIRLLKKFMSQKEILCLSEHEDISYQDFIHFVIDQKKDPEILLSEDFLKSKTPDAALFCKFKNSGEDREKDIDEDIDKNAPLPKLPTDILFHMTNFLDPKTMIKFGSTASIFYSFSISDLCWKKHLIQAGMNEELLNEIIKSKAIKNFKVLYRAFTQLPCPLRTSIMDPWQIYYLSGDPSAIQYAIKNDGFTKETKDYCGRSAVHYLGLSGVPAFLDYGIKTLKISKNDLLTEDKDGRTLVHYAAWSASRDMLTHVAHDLGLNVKKTDHSGRTIAHYSAWSGSPKLLKYAIDYFHLNIHVKDNDGSGIQHYAALSKVPAQLAFIKELKLPMDEKDDLGRTILHFAALSGEPLQLSFVIDILNISPLEKDNDQRNIMHYAAWSGEKDQLAYAVALGFNPKIGDKHRRNTMHYAAMSGTNQQIDYTILKLDLNPSQVDALNFSADFYASRSPALFFANQRIRKCLQEKEIRQLEQKI